MYDKSMYYYFTNFSNKLTMVRLVLLLIEIFLVILNNSCKH